MPPLQVPVYRDIRKEGVVGNAVIDGDSITGTLDTVAMNRAVQRGQTIVLPKGNFYLDGEFTWTNNARLVGQGSNDTKIYAPNGYSSNGSSFDSSFCHMGDECKIEGMSIIELEADQQDSSLVSAFGYGLRMGSRCVIEDVTVSGFNFGLALFASSEFNQFVNCLFTKSRSWSEIDSSPYHVFERCEFSYNGLDGFKIQNQSDDGRASDGLRMHMCSFHHNGRRDILYGGDENTNGHGIDSFDGGSDMVISQCHMYENPAAGFVQKGGNDKSTSVVITGCIIENNTRSNAEEFTGHGIELGTGGGSNCRNFRLTDNVIRGNNGTGLFIHDGAGLVMSGNVVYANRDGVKIQSTNTTDIDLNDTLMAGNFQFNLILGSSDTASTINRRYNIRGGIISGKYNPSGFPIDDIPNITVTPTAWDESTNTITSDDHGFVEGECVSLQLNSGTFPASVTDELPIEEERYYYIFNVTEDTFQLSEHRLDDAAIDFGAGGANINVSTIHSEWTMRSYQSINDVLFDGVRFYEQRNQNGMIVRGNEIRFKDCRFVQFKRIALRLEGRAYMCDCIFEDYDNDGNGASWAAMIIDDGDVIMDRVRFDGINVAGTTAIRLLGTGELKHQDLTYNNYTTQIDNDGTGTVTAR